MPRVNVILQELPSINFIRSCQTILQIIGETLAVYRIGKVEKWDQLSSYGTGRRHTDIHNLVIGFINEEHLFPLILSTSIIMEVETSDKQINAVLSTIVGCRKRLQRWVEVMDHSHPSYQKNIQDPTSINIGKLGSGSTLT